MHNGIMRKNNRIDERKKIIMVKKKYNRNNKATGISA